MPRRTLIRRFEPRYSVSAEMIQRESTYIRRELDDYLLQSLSDLTDCLVKRYAAVERVEEELQLTVGTLPDRERLAIRCLLSRDLWHFGKLYVAAIKDQACDTDQPTMPIEMTPTHQPRAILAFRDSLFD